jgi:long-chain fatty acid transport protein
MDSLRQRNPEPPMGDRFRSQVLTLFGALLVVCADAPAQTTAEVNAGVQFNFSTPGARSLGLGGAFIGLADDATAAYANPAGLTVLSEPEISFEGRNWSYNNSFVNGGRLIGSPSGTGIDTVAGLRAGDSESTENGVSFLSAVYPRRRWAVALYRHQLAKYQAEFTTPGAFTQPAQRTRPKINSFSLDVVHFGLAGAFRLGDRLSLGAGISLYDFSLFSRTDRYALSPDLGTAPGGTFGPPLLIAGNLVDTQLQTGDERRTGFNAGFQYQVAPGWTMGGVYRQGPEFDFDAIYVPGPQAATAPESGLQRVTRRARYHMPDVFGLGAAVQPTELTTVTLDVVRVEYSNLTRKVINILLLLPRENTGSDLRNFKVDDATEIHLGFERNFPRGGTLVAARVGAWYDPDHRIRYDGTTPGFQAAFQPGQDEIHYAAGFGFIVPRLKLQADAAFDYSDPVKTASLSTVVRF